ncbi:hypothetical protein D5I55_12770 [Chakrabartia godavariana]|nr:hypothetical protein D5I55_12770 [Chakrabartia godavariana]
MRILPVLALPLVLCGCVAQMAANVVTAPFKVAGAVIDATTTSQSEADEKRGREMRKAEERQRKADKKAAKATRERAEESE